MNNVKGTCKDCEHSETFNKRDDEPSNIGCKRLNFEGYTTADSTCEAFSPSSKLAKSASKANSEAPAA